jgi:hypothetical protein
MRLLLIATLISLVAVSAPASACKELAKYPEHLSGNEPGWARQYRVVMITDSAPQRIDAVVMQHFGDNTDVGKKVELRFIAFEEAHAVCPISLEKGKTYRTPGRWPGSRDLSPDVDQRAHHLAGRFHHLRAGLRIQKLLPGTHQRGEQITAIDSPSRGTCDYRSVAARPRHGSTDRRAGALHYVRKAAGRSNASHKWRECTARPRAEL